MSIINNGLLLASGADAATTYQISRSLRFNSADSAYLSRTPSSAGNRKTWTWSGWVKTCNTKSSEHYMFSAAGSGQFFIFGISNNDEFFINPAAGVGGASFVSSNRFRDRSAWYHFVVAFDSTQATSTNRLKVYVNGTALTWSTASYPTQNTDWHVNNNVEHRIGSSTNGTGYIDQYLADIYLLDGTATDPSTFAETDAVTGQWVPKTPTGISYGTNGFRLTFSDNSGTTSTTLGKDAAGSNNWTPNNFSVASGSGNDSLVDSPTSYGTDTSVGGEVRGNYCVANPLDNGGITLANGNLDLSRNSGVEWLSIRGTIGMTSGKWYWEFTPTAFDQNMVLGIIDNTGIVTSYLDINARGYGYRPDGKKVNNNSASAYGASWTTNDVIGFAFNADNQELIFYKNGVSQGVAFTVTAGYTYFPAASLRVAGGSSSGTYNFGARAFSYQAPSGFKALCDTNLTAPVIAKPSTVMDVKLYTGNGSTQTISGLGFSPDLLWIKCRNNADNHAIQDAVRGATYVLQSNSTNAEINAANTVGSFTSDGFTLAGAAGSTNGSSATYAAWAWDAGSSTVTNTQGSITSSVRANPSAGFSIVTYTGNGTSGATVGHGLNVAPGFVIIKSRNQSGQYWHVWHQSFTAGEYIYLNTTGAKTSGADFMNNTLPGSSVFTLGNGAACNQNGGTHVAYAFSPVSGYSSFGSYTGNGSTDGPFVYTGFRPAWVLIKCSTQATYWNLKDNKRYGYNPTDPVLHPNLSDAESATQGIDLCSNGFKVRTSDGGYNTNGATYIYAAFAESPFQYARAR